MATTEAMLPAERRRRFWRAHGRSLEHLTVLRVLSMNPEDPWTAERFRRWYGLPTARVRAILDELNGCGVVREAPCWSTGPAYRWNHELDWAVPGDR